jgi:glycerol transport system ATP-binding protein
VSIELRDISKLVGGETHIYPTNLTLKPGGFNILLGTTLSGKTTLLRLMAGLDKPTTGEVWFEGQNVTRLPVQRRSVSMVYQQFINYPNFNVFDNIASPLRVAKVSATEIKKRVEKIAEMLKLQAFLTRIPAELSGGQQQRIAIARALVKDSKLVLLDEPLANLDYKLREELRDEMPKLFADTGATVVYSTTEPLEALMLGGHTATLHQGQVSQCTSTTEGFRQPNNLTSARVFSDPPINVAKVEKRADRFYLNDISWAVPNKLQPLADGPFTIGIRPHHLSVGQKSDSAISLEGVVQITEISGSESMVHLDISGLQWVSESRGIHSFAVGEKAQVYMHVAHCLYFDQNEQLIRI